MKLNKVIYKVGFEGQYKKFTFDIEQINFQNFCEKCRKAFNIKPNNTILLNFYENDKQLIIRNEIDFAIAIHSNVYNTQKKSISFKISAVPAENQLNASQVTVQKKLTSSQSVQKGGQSDVEISKKEMLTILEKGLKHNDSQQILKNICDSVPQQLEQIQIKQSSAQYLVEILNQNINEIFTMKKQCLQISKDTTELSQNQMINTFSNQNKTESCNNINQIALTSSQTNIATPVHKQQDLSESFNAQITQSNSNFQQSFDNIFQQFNQSIQQITKSLRTNKDNIIRENQNKSFDYNIISIRESQKTNKCSALDQFNMLNQFIENIDSEMEKNEQQLIQNLNILQINDLKKNKIKKNQQQCEKQKIQTDLFDGIIKHVQHNIDDELPAPFSQLKNDESTFQKIYK